MMKIIELFKIRSRTGSQDGAITLAFLGDSITQGCFEVFENEDGNLEPIYDVENAYHTYLKRSLEVLYPSVRINVINAGVSGDNAGGGLKRLEKDVLRYAPDFVVVCFGLNDCGMGVQSVSEYSTALSGIFERLKKAGIETLFMTPNMMNTKISCHLESSGIREIAKNTLELQKSGVLNVYVESAKEVCKRYQVPVCDCYEEWCKLEAVGVDVTSLLSNHINHPTRQMNWLFSIKILEMMFENQECTVKR